MTKSVRLEAPSASGKKFYAIDKVMAGNGFLVNFSHGAVGGSVKTGTKTKEPVSDAAADKIVADLLREKQTGGSHYEIVAVANEAPQFIPPPATKVKCIPPRLLNDVADMMAVQRMVDDSRWWVQVKHDGDRVQLHAVAGGEPVLFSARSGLLRACPQRIVKAVARLPSSTSFILDGELVGEVLWAFDLLNLDADLMAEPYILRYRYLRLLLTALDPVQLVEAAWTPEDKARMILDAKANHEEGVCFIRADAPYESGRPASGGNNLRWKFKVPGTFIVLGHNGTTSITVGLHDGTRMARVSMIGKGPLPALGSVVEVEYLYAQRSLNQPVFKGVRPDVKPEACTRAQLQFKRGIDPLGKTA